MSKITGKLGDPCGAPIFIFPFPRTFPSHSNSNTLSQKNSHQQKKIGVSMSTPSVRNLGCICCLTSIGMLTLFWLDSDAVYPSRCITFPLLHVLPRDTPGPCVFLSNVPHALLDVCDSFSPHLRLHCSMFVSFYFQISIPLIIFKLPITFYLIPIMYLILSMCINTIIYKIQIIWVDRDQVRQTLDVSYTHHMVLHWDSNGYHTFRPIWRRGSNNTKQRNVGKPISLVGIDILKLEQHI